MIFHDCRFHIQNFRIFENVFIHYFIIIFEFLSIISKYDITKRKQTKNYTIFNFYFEFAHHSYYVFDVYFIQEFINSKA